MLLDIKKDFSRFLGMNPQRLHFAAHSHHFWPDVTFEAQQQAWNDAAMYADKKWASVFSELMPTVRQGIATRLNLPDANTLCFAPNTHEFILRLLSSFEAGKKIKILTTDSEFYSFRRQIKRLAEDGLVEITRIPTLPFDSFSTRFKQAIQDDTYDLIFFSHVFFNAGFVVHDFEQIVSTVTAPETVVVVDGYHGFMALPTDLSTVHDRVFYLAGGYKYAMAGEGACFMHCPSSYALRPKNTGWYAEMDSLAAEKSDKVDYETGGARFFGATFDPSGLYRMRAVFSWLDNAEISIEDIHQHVIELQELFLEKTSLTGLMVPDAKNRGHFLTFDRNDAAALEKRLADDNIITDRRGNRLRFGFGIYHDRAEILRLVEKLQDIK